MHTIQEDTFKIQVIQLILVFRLMIYLISIYIKDLDQDHLVDMVQEHHHLLDMVTHLTLVKDMLIDTREYEFEPRSPEGPPPPSPKGEEEESYEPVSPEGPPPSPKMKKKRAMNLCHLMNHHQNQV